MTNIKVNININSLTDTPIHNHFITLNLYELLELDQMPFYTF